MKKLVKQAKNGNKDAFNKLIYYYQNDLYRIAKTRLLQDDDIYDAIQETIISAYKSISKLHNISSFKSWIIKILINNCNNIYTSNNCKKTVPYDSIQYENQIVSHDNLSSNLEFDNLMNLLNYDERTILVLYYVEGYKSIEIAKILDINENTVRSKILRAKTKIKNNVDGGLYYG